MSAAIQGKNMRNFGSICLLCALALLAGATALKAQQTPNPDPAITALSVMGVVSDFKPDTRQVIVTTAAGSQVTITLSDRTSFMRIPPGEKSKDKFIKIAPADFAVGDSVFARGRMWEDQLPAFTLEELKPGESIIVSSTKSADPARVTAIAVVSGGGPLLQNNRWRRRATARHEQPDRS
jgi:hypothetical protein